MCMDSSCRRRLSIHKASIHLSLPLSLLVQTPTIHRQSVVQFGRVVGLPDRVQRDLHAHARHAVTERGVETSSAGSTEADRLPHIERAEGVLSVSAKAAPVPLLSPQRDDYRENLQELAAMQGCDAIAFADVDEMVAALERVKQRDPFKLECGVARKWRQCKLGLETTLPRRTK